MAAHIAGEHDRAAQIVLTVGVELANHRLAKRLGDTADHRTRHAVQQQLRLDHPQVFHQQAGSFLVTRQVHVQRTVRLDVLQAHPLGTGNFAQCTQLVKHVVDQLLGWRVDVPATEADKVTKTRVRTHRHAQGLGPLNGTAHGTGVASMKARGDVCRAYVAHQLVVDAVANGPRTKSLTHVRVEIHHLHDCLSWCL
ncbi:hypothetical protein D3C76_1243860 [compost metagenome]